jgi:hypothetical protein
MLETIACRERHAQNSEDEVTLSWLIAALLAGHARRILVEEDASVPCRDGNPL